MEEKKEKLFREKSLDRISSPDQLDKYIKTSTPTIIILFIALAVFLCGVVVWSLFGEIESKSNVGFAATANGEGYDTSSYITETDYQNFIAGKEDSYIAENMYLSCESYTLKIKSFSNLQVYEKADKYNNVLANVAGIEENDQFRIVYSTCTENIDGLTGKIVYSKINPIKYLFA